MAGSGRGRRKRAGKLKARQAALKDATSDIDPADELSEELTALAAIFQDDFNLISEKPFVEFTINMRPHSIDDEDCEEYAAAELFVRCLPGYPQRPPKLQITPKKGLTNEQLRYLHSLLADQAASIAREGRVMIFSLTEAAQEFLSDQQRAKNSVEGQTDDYESGTPPLTSTEEDWHCATPTALHLAGTEPNLDDSVYLDLFKNMWGDSDVQSEESQVATSSLQPDGHRDGAALYKQKQFWENTWRPDPLLEGHEGPKLGVSELPMVTDRHLATKDPFQHELLKSPEENCPDSDAGTLASPTNGHSTSASELLKELCAGLGDTGHDAELFEHLEESRDNCNNGNATRDNSSLLSTKTLRALRSPEDLATKSIQKDFVLGYLLRLACSPRGPLPRSLPVLASELQKNGILSEWAKDLLASQPQLFDATFRRMFCWLSKDKMLAPVSRPLTSDSAVDLFWSANPELLGEGKDRSLSSSSRYLSDFEEISLLGRGGFGYVVLCKNKLDGRLYAMKKIRLKDKSPVANDKILREVATLARLQHHYVVRYYQAWIETGVGHLQLTGNSGLENTGGSENRFVQERVGVGSHPWTDVSTDEETTLAQSTFLYIQMEYCPRTLRELLDSWTWSVDKDKDEIWRMFRQLVEGLAHIHGQGILHRDLNPNNIFFDSRGDIKIGDFGLAKFMNLEQTDRDIKPINPAEVTAVFFEGTGKVGTYFYTAPEMGLPDIDSKVDIYSLGVVFFEFWYPFGTGMERFNILNDLKQRGLTPDIWSSEFPEQAKLVGWLMDPNPADRPSAAQVLRSELFPPRMENESLNDILRTIQKADDTSVYDQVVAAIFDNERSLTKGAHVDTDWAHLKRCEKDKSLIKLVGHRDQLLEYVKEVFVRHGARRVESSCFNVVDDLHYQNRQVANLLDSSGNLLDARYETRSSLARWVAATQMLSLRSYELSPVYRRSVGDNAPREYFQGDFDIIGGAPTLAEAEAVKVAVEVLSKFPVWNSFYICINHRQILRAIWIWTGVQTQQKQKVAQILALMGSAPPQSPARKALWPFVRRQLLQGLHLPEIVVDRLQTVERRLTGRANEVLSRLRGALPPSETTSAAIDTVSTLVRYLRIWRIEQFVFLDALMTVTEDFYNGVFFQVHVPKTSNYNRNSLPATCIAVGGGYDQLIAKHWSNYSTSPTPGAVGLSIAVQRLIDTSIAERSETATEVLVCSKGGGGLLVERMEIVDDLWSANIKAENMSSEAPSLTEQYEYAHDNHIKWLVIITEAALSLAGTVKVRHLDLKVDEDVPKAELVKYLTDMFSTSVNLRKKASSMRSTS